MTTIALLRRLGPTVLLVTTLGACSSGTSDSSGPPSPSGTSTAAGGSPGSGADAGAKEPPSSNTDVVLTGGAAAAPPPEQAPTLTAQIVADTLFQGGLRFSGGSTQHPAYVRCTDGFPGPVFQCYIQVRDIAPYNVRVSERQGVLTFDYLGYAQQ